jgi:hypothetical protein
MVPHPRILEENTEIIKEVCLHHLSEKHKTEDCKICSPDYDLKKTINNYSCPYYDPQLQIDYDKFLEKAELTRPLTGKEKEVLKFEFKVINSGLINCNGHKLKIEHLEEWVLERLNELNIHRDINIKYHRQKQIN